MKNMILRYDDTNPEAEQKEYINHIEGIVNWMGWEPVKVLLFSVVGIAYCSYYFILQFPLFSSRLRTLVIISKNCTIWQWS